MVYQEYKPSPVLGQYVKCYYLLEYGKGSLIEDHAFATGCIEVMFTLEGSLWQTKSKDAFTATSPIELWGQILQPLAFKITGQSKVFGIRFHPATAAFFLQQDINQFSDCVLDLTTVMGNAIADLHARLQEATNNEQRVKLTEIYLLKKIDEQSRIISKINLVQQIMNELSHKDFFDNIENVAARYGLTARYLQKVFARYTGLTPKLYSKVNRFQNSVVLLGKQKHALTDIALECGYFDQSHFIREFKSFTGYSPSYFNPVNSTAVLASPNK